jgi:Tfp pilus tip-associated adhesin PilY1
VRFDAVYIGSGDREHPLVQTNPVAPAPATPKTAADMMFMVMDREPGLTSSDAAPIVLADMFNILDTATTGATAADLVSTKQGWFRGLDNGEKVVNAPTVFFNKLRFGTYAVLGQSNACTPPGEGRLNEIDALTGDLFNLNTGDGLTASDRYYSSYLVRGYVSSGQLIIVDTTGGGGPPPPPGTPAECGKKVYHVTVADGQMQSVLIGTLCGATRIYWYMEPEQ